MVLLQLLPVLFVFLFYLKKWYHVFIIYVCLDWAKEACILFLVVNQQGNKLSHERCVEGFRHVSVSWFEYDFRLFKSFGQNFGPYTSCLHLALTECL